MHLLSLSFLAKPHFGVNDSPTQISNMQAHEWVPMGANSLYLSILGVTKSLSSNLKELETIWEQG